MPRKTLLILVIITEGGALLLALLLARYYSIPLSPLSSNPLRDVLMGTLLAMIPFLLFILSLSKWAERIPMVGSLKKILVTDIRGIFSQATPLDLIGISLMAGVAEELLFRGVIQVKLGIIGASIIFGLLHSVTPAYVVIATVMGLYLGILFQLYESLLIPIHIHFLYDLGALLYLRYSFEGQDLTS